MKKGNLMLSLFFGTGLLLAGCGNTEEPPPEEEPAVESDEQAPPDPDGTHEMPDKPEKGTTENDENLTEQEKDTIEDSVDDK